MRRVGWLIGGLAFLVLLSGCCARRPCTPCATTQISRVPQLPRRPRGDYFSLERQSTKSKVGVDEPGLEALPERTDERLIIGSWNIKWFGSRDPDWYDYVTMADFIEECDVVALQEVVYPNHEAVLARLANELHARGRNYTYVVSNATGYENNPHPEKGRYLERFAYLWDAARIERYGTARFMRHQPINNAVYRQVPYVANFRVLGGQGFDFRIATTHTVYKSELNWVRRDEIEDLVRWVTSSQGDGEEDLIAIGDFNAHPPGQPHHFDGIVSAANGIRVPMNESRDAPEDTIRTTAPTLTSSNNPAYLRLPVYDHAVVAAPSVPLIENPMTQATRAVGVFEFDQDPWWRQNGWAPREVISVVSDHRPIWITLDYDTPDAD